MVSEATLNSSLRISSEFLKGYDAGVRAAIDEREPDPTQWFTKEYLDSSVSKARAEALEEAAKLMEDPENGWMDMAQSAAASIERKDAALRMALDVISTILADENALDCIFEKDKQKLRDAASAISAALKE